MNKGQKFTKRTLVNRILKLEGIVQSRIDHAEQTESRDRDDLTGDYLLRMWEYGDDWVRERTAHVIRQCEGLSPGAKVRLQERLKILQTGSPEEILLEIARLASDTPEWASSREEEVLAGATKLNPAIGKAAAKFGISGVGPKNWPAFTSFLERHIKAVPVEDPKLEGISQPHSNLGQATWSG